MIKELENSVSQLDIKKKTHRQMRKDLSSTSAAIFEHVGAAPLSRSTQCRILKGRHCLNYPKQDPQREAYCLGTEIYEDQFPRCPLHGWGQSYTRWPWYMGQSLGTTLCLLPALHSMSTRRWWCYVLGWHHRKQTCQTFLSARRCHTHQQFLHYISGELFSMVG